MSAPEKCHGDPCICPPTEAQLAVVVHHIHCRTERHSHDDGICTFGDCPCFIPLDVTTRPGQATP